MIPRLSAWLTVSPRHVCVLSRASDLDWCVTLFIGDRSVGRGSSWHPDLAETQALDQVLPKPRLELVQ